MNARLYDPMLHRFLAPDNYVQDPYSTQNFNRYGYVLNNPLRYSDPSGEMPILVAALIGAAISVTVNGIANISHGQNFFHNWGMAALTGFIGGATANIIGNANLGFLRSTLAHAHLGAMMTGISGGNPLHGAISGALGSLIGAGTGKALENTKSAWLAGGIMAVSGGVAGGFGSAIAAGSFWDGFRNGFISAGLNHAVHRVYAGIKTRNILKAMLGKEWNDRLPLWKGHRVDPEYNKYIKNFVNKYELLKEWYEKGGSPDIVAYHELDTAFGRYIHGRRLIKINTMAVTTKYLLARTLLHESFHAYQHVHGYTFSHLHGSSYYREIQAHSFTAYYTYGDPYSFEKVDYYLSLIK